MATSPKVTSSLSQSLSRMCKTGSTATQKQNGTHEKCLSLLDFEKQERAKEVNEQWLDHSENIEQDIFSAQESREEADKQANQAKKRAAQYEKKLTEIVPMIKDMEWFAEIV